MRISCLVGLVVCVLLARGGSKDKQTDKEERNGRRGDEMRKTYFVLSVLGSIKTL